MAIEAVYGGSAEFGGGGVLEPMVARGNGLDMMFVAASTHIRSNPPDNSGIAVRSGDNINAAKDLVGKKVSAGLINGPNYVHTREWLQRHGVDPTSVEFLEIPYPQMAERRAAVAARVASRRVIFCILLDGPGAGGGGLTPGPRYPRPTGPSGREGGMVTRTKLAGQAGFGEVGRAGGSARSTSGSSCPARRQSWSGPPPRPSCSSTPPAVTGCTRCGG